MSWLSSVSKVARKSHDPLDITGKVNKKVFNRDVSFRNNEYTNFKNTFRSYKKEENTNSEYSTSIFQYGNNYNNTNSNGYSNNPFSTDLNSSSSFFAMMKRLTAMMNSTNGTSSSSSGTGSNLSYNA